MLPLEIAAVFMQVPAVAADVIVQLMLPVPVTVPLPVLPVAFTVTVVWLKVALTAWLAVMVAEQAPPPLQAPPQVPNAEPAGILDVLKVTLLPWMNGALQVPVRTPAVDVQLIPAGLLVTVPVPALNTPADVEIVSPLPNVKLPLGALNVPTKT